MTNKHSVRLNRELCVGCTNCIKKCPTGAIRVRSGKAQINEYRCIDCGECIRACPHHAKSASMDLISRLDFVDLQEDIVQGMRCASIETAEGLTHAILSPLSGTVIARNPDLGADPHIVEKDPYFAGWLYRVIPSNPEYELSHLTPCGSDTI